MDVNKEHEERKLKLKEYYKETNHLLCSNKNCNGSGTLDLDRVFHPGHEHIAQCVPKKSQTAYKFQQAIAKEAATNLVKPKEIYNIVRKSGHTQGSVEVAFGANIKKLIARKRRDIKEQEEKKAIEKIMTLEGLAAYMTSPKFNNKLLQLSSGKTLDVWSIECGEEGGRILIYVNDELLKSLNSEWIFLDGTFDALPPIKGAQQLVTITVLKKNKAIPVLMAVMERKNERAYLVLLNHLRDIAPHIEPGHAMCDFERGLRNAIMKVYPTAKRHGCFFHFCQVLRRYAKSKCGQRIRADLKTAEGKKILHGLMALALFPAGDIPQVFELLKQNMPPARNKMWASFFNYFRSEWITKVKPKGFSVFGVDHRTNNKMESFHSTLASSMGSKPTVWNFLKGLRDVFDEANLHAKQLEIYDSISKKLTPKQRGKEAAILKLWEEMREAKRNVPALLESATGLIG